MKFFNFAKKDKILDLSNYKREEIKHNEVDEPNTDNSEELVLDLETLKSPEEKKKKLAKRISGLTDNIEDLSNKIYHLQQRIELLERKLNINIS